MSSSTQATSPRDRLAAAPWQLWLTQTLNVARIELRKNILTRRGFGSYLLAFLPALAVFMHGYVSQHGVCNLDEDTKVLAGIFQLYYLRLAVFFGCMGIFTWLFRGEVVEKSLHYYFLSPVRRELLVIGKFIAGAATSILIFGTGVFLCFFFMYSHMGARGSEFVFRGPGLGQLWSYMLVTVLACLGYGAVFLALSLIFKNPVLPGIFFLGWEGINAVLPSLLQKISITFYLKNLTPVAVAPDGLMALFTVVAEPVRPWVAVIGLLLLAAAVLVFACFRIRYFEISYSTD